MGFTIALVLLLLGWFWYPRLLATKEATPFNHLPASTWAVLEMNGNQKNQLLADSTAIIPYFIPSDLLSTLKALSDEVNILVYFYGLDNNLEFGIIANQALPVELTKSFEDRRTLGKFHQYQTKPLTDQTNLQNGFPELETLKSNLSSLTLFLKPKRLLASSILNSSETLKQILEANFKSDEWLALDLDDQNGIFRLSGVEQRSGETIQDQSSSLRTTRLLNYLPSATGISSISVRDSIVIALAYCPYFQTDTLVEEQLFVYLEHTKALDSNLSQAQLYQGIPVSLEAIPLQNLPVTPSWYKSAYAAQISNHVKVFASSFEAIAKLIDDYVADDRLSTSAHFSPIESYVSDASYTLVIKPDELIFGSGKFLTQAISTPINTLIYQSFEELPLQQFHALTILHHQEIKDIAPVAWETKLDTSIYGGPWRFINHYTKEDEILVQDAKNQLYLIDRSGRVLWKKQINEPINKEIYLVDAFGNAKYQLAFTTSTALHIIDRNGSELKGYPVPLENGCFAPPLCVRYNNKGDYRFICQNGNKLVNFDADGKAVKGWTKYEINSGELGKLSYVSYNGKDYLIALDGAQEVHIIDRAGKTRLPSFQLDTAVHEIYFLEGKRFEDCRIVGHDDYGNLFSYSLSGQEEQENMLPVGKDVGLFANSNDDFRYITIKEDRVVALNKERNVKLDYLMPEPMDLRLQWADQKKGWLGIQNRSNDAYYILDLEGRLLDKMPLKAIGHGITISLGENAGSVCVLPSKQTTITAYKLTD
jgi:hypothetical protein